MVEIDLWFGVCDWGYCVYCFEILVCFGGEVGFNLVFRIEIICLICVNFVVMF